MSSSWSSAGAPLLGNSVITSHLQELGYPEKSLKSMLKCGVETGFKILSHCGCKNKIINVTHHCSLRTCLDCSKIRKRKISRKYFPFLQSLYQNRRDFLYFLTISPENYKNIKEGLEHIKKSFSRFLRHNYVKERIRGGLYVVEVKGEEGNWNIHIHAIIYGRYIDNKVRKEKDSKVVRLFKQSSKTEVNIHVKKQDSARFTLNYMLKYISANKDDFNTSLDMAKYIIATRKKRLIHTFGEFYNIKIKKSKCICNKCNQEIEYIIDLEVVLYVEEKMNELKPPDLEYWFI